LAGDVATAWNSDLAGVTSDEWSLTAVDIQDIATDMGLSGTVSVSHPGTQAGGTPASQVAINCEFNIARRYRGGKPRWYQPGSGASNVQDGAHWTTAFVTTNNAAVLAFFTAVEALSVGAMGTLDHVNLSYYKGFTNVTNSSGRTRAAPNYRAAAVVDSVTGYATKQMFGSQRRRRASTTP
jgi:hypothetical protein